MKYNLSLCIIVGIGLIACSSNKTTAVNPTSENYCGKTLSINLGCSSESKDYGIHWDLVCEQIKNKSESNSTLSKTQQFSFVSSESKISLCNQR